MTCSKSDESKFTMKKESQRSDYVRYAVVGFGHVNPIPVLPAILSARKK
jgi:hypothetical protein